MADTQHELALDELVAASSYPSAEALLHGMAERLQYSWDRYTTFIHQVLLLTGGTILVLLNVLSDKDSLFRGHPGGVAPLVLAGLAMVAGMFWRLISQYFMDREVLGSADDVRGYFGMIGVRSSSDYAEKYYGEQGWHAVYRSVFRWIAYATVALLLAAWVAAALMVLSLDEKDEKTSTSTPGPSPTAGR